MKYWVSYAAFQSLELAADIILIYLIPFYYFLKLLVIAWLVYGTRIVYDSIINRELTKREKTIDKQLNRIFKLRDEIIATIWYELSRCSVRIVTTLMSGGLSVLTKSHPEHDQNSICYETSPANTAFASSTYSRMLNYNNNEINYRRSKRNLRIEEVVDDKSDQGEEAMDCDDTRSKEHDITVEYIITEIE